MKGNHRRSNQSLGKHQVSPTKEKKEGK
jgi:hypothetical protein